MKLRSLFETFAGIHRVQRVSKTEKNGRRHSSIVTIFHTNKELLSEFVINKKDIRIDTYRDRGNGGQHKNVTDSAVRITHLPTNIIVTATEDRSQIVNREVAMSRLKKKLQEQQYLELKFKENSERAKHFIGKKDWSWCSWRDEVISPTGKSMSMKSALKGNLKGILDDS